MGGYVQHPPEVDRKLLRLVFYASTQRCAAMPSEFDLCCIRPADALGDRLAVADVGNRECSRNLRECRRCKPFITDGTIIMECMRACQHNPQQGPGQFVGVLYFGWGTERGERLRTSASKIDGWLPNNCHAHARAGEPVCMCTNPASDIVKSVPQTE